MSLAMDYISQLRTRATYTAINSSRSVEVQEELDSDYESIEILNGKLIRFGTGAT